MTLLLAFVCAGIHAQTSTFTYIATEKIDRFEEIGYFIELDHELDVKPYFMEIEREYWDECGASTIFVSRARVFCSNDIDLTPYRTRHVRITGWFESREFGWRNAGPAVFIIQQVEVLENGE